MKKRIMTMLLAMLLALEGIGTAPVAAQAEEPVTGGANTNTSMETALELTSGKGAEVTIGEGEAVYYSFTPEEAGWYEFYSESAKGDDVQAALLDANGEILKEDDNGGTNLQFSITYNLETGNIYYLQVEPVGEGSKSVTVIVDKARFFAYANNADVSVKYGESATLEVTAYSAEGTLSYQWQYFDVNTGNWVQIENATESSYQAEVTEGVLANYRCEVTDGTETKTCQISLHIDTGLELEQTSVTIEAKYGETATLSVSANGVVEGLEFNYRWFYLDEESGSYKRIENATESSYEVEVTEGVPLNYACDVTDGIKIKSCAFTLFVDTGLAAEAEQQSVNISDGVTGNLSVLITGGAEGLNLNYEWYYYDEDTGGYIPIEGAIGNSYEITGNQETKKKYQCRVTDGFQTAIVYFDVNVVSAKGDFDVTKEMEFSAADFASEMEITYKITSDKDMAYRFYSTGDSDPYIKILDSSLQELASADDDADLNFSLQYVLKAEEVYYLVIGVYPEVENKTFTVKTEEQSFMAQAKGDTYVVVPYGEAVTLEVEAYSADGNIRYQWYRGNTAIEGATESSLEITGNEDTFSDYSCEVTSGTETIPVNFHIEIDTGLTVTSEHTGMVPYGGTATLSVHADGGVGEPRYQWYYRDEDTGEFVPIEDATESSYEITGTTDMPQLYKCSVSDEVITQDRYFNVMLDTGLKIEAVNNDFYLEYGETATLSVQASGGMGEISYQWRCLAEAVDGNNAGYVRIADATDSSLEIIARTESHYLCIITDGIASISVPFLVTVKNPGEAVKLEEVAEATLAYTAITYDGSSKLPQVTVKDSGVTLIAGKDYTVNYSNNTAAGTATVTITGKGAYTGTITKTFAILPISITGAAVTLAEAGYTYDGTAKTPAVTVKAGNTVLVKDTDYTVTYSNNTNVGTATVTIIGKGNYTGTATRTFTITEGTKKPVSISNATVSLSKTSYNYDGKAKTPAVTVKVGNTVLVKDTDYTVSYTKNKNIGTATVTITGKGNYTGTLKKTFKIKAKKGTTFTVGSYKYKITGSNTVAFAGLKSSKTRKVTVAKTVKIGGKTFKITSIADKALYKKSKVTSVTIGANVTKIGKSAFEKCSKLKTITIKSTKLKTVGKKAFKGIKSNATIKVPSKKLNAYKKLLKGKGQGSKVTIKKA